MHAFWNVWDFFAPVDYIPLGCAAFILILLAPEWIRALREAYRWCRDLLRDEPPYFHVTDYGWHLSDDHKAARREFDRELHAYDFRHFQEPTDEEQARRLHAAVVQIDDYRERGRAS